MAIRSDEIISIIKSAIDTFDEQVETRSVGTVVEVGRAVTRVKPGDRVAVDQSLSDAGSRASLGP